MRTTLNIDDQLLTQAKSLAAKEHLTLTRLIEEGLAMRLRTRAEEGERRAVKLPVFAGKGGLNETVKDPTSHRALLDAADDTP